MLEGNELVTFIVIFVALLVGFIVIILIGYLGVNFVGQGQEYTVERLGKYVKTLRPGFNLIIPLLDRISNQVDMREQVMDVPSQDVITRDNAIITVDGVVFYKVIDAARATYQVNNLRNAIEHLTTTNLRTVMGSMDLDDLLSKREEINSALFKVVDQATDPWGVKIVRIEIKDITPPKDLVDAMARQMKAERIKRAAILEAEGQRKADSEKAEGEKTARIREAEGKKEALILEAQGYREAEILKAQARKEATRLEAESRDESAICDAHARERLAAAEAKATALVSQAILKGDIQAINYFIALKYIDALQSIASANNQKLIMMPLEASSLISSLSGIGDIAKEILLKKETVTESAKELDKTVGKMAEPRMIDEKPASAPADENLP